jgi:3-hydroxybutyryl-CoA dehydrogenase
MNSMIEVGIVGAGMMGGEIALCFAMAGSEVYLKDINLELAQKGKNNLTVALDKLIKKGRFSPEDRERTLSRITPVETYDYFKDEDLVVEAVIEDLETKKKVFREIDAICKPDCIFATNTSSISITLLATSVGPLRIRKFLGTHFFSPASVMKLVEVIPGLETEENIVTFIMECCRKIGKTPIRVRDVVGFAANRILHAMWIEANRLVEEGVASTDDIDTACKLGLGHPIGPYALMDLTGNDLNLRVQEILFEAYGERFKPRPILKQKVFANHLGRKTGRGWFEYEK